MKHGPAKKQPWPDRRLEKARKRALQAHWYAMEQHRQLMNAMHMGAAVSAQLAAAALSGPSFGGSLCAGDPEPPPVIH